MRQLTADTKIRIKAPRRELTGETRIRLCQIKDYKIWTLDRVHFIGETTIHADGTKWVKVSNGEWKQVSNGKGARKRQNPKTPKKYRKGLKDPAIKGFNINKENLKKNQHKLQHEIIGSVTTGGESDRVYNSEVKEKEKRNALAKWAAKKFKSPVQTEIGDVKVEPQELKKDLDHSARYYDRETIQLVEKVLKNGVYIGNCIDLDGGSFTNYYICGKVKINGKQKYMFCRIRKADGDRIPGTTEDYKRFRLHNIFIDDDIKKGSSLKSSTWKNPMAARGRPLHAMLLNNYLFVK